MARATSSRTKAVKHPLSIQGEIDTTWFRNLLADCKITQRKLADTLNRHPAAVTLLLRGKRRMLPKDASAIAELTGAPLMEVMRRAGVPIPTDPGSLPVDLEADDQGTVKKSRRVLRTPAAPGMTSRASVVRWNGLGAESGWLLYFDAPGAGVPPEAIGRVCLVTVKGMPGQYVRVVRNGYGAGKFNLDAWPGHSGAESAEGVVLSAAAPLLWVRAA